MASPVTSNFPNQSGAFRLEMHYWYIGQSIETNRSSFGWSVWVKKNRAYSMNSSSGSSVSATFNGVTVLSVANFAYDLTNADEVLLGSGTVTLDHASDGKLGQAGAQASANMTYLGSTTTPMGYISAPTIPRASTASIAAPYTRDIGDAITINTNRASSTFTHKITYKFGNATGTVGTGIGASVNWTPPLSLLNQIPNGTSALVDLVTTTYAGNAEIGRKTSQFTLAAATNIVPTISSVSVSDQNPTVVSQIGAFVQGQSQLKATVNAAGAYGSTIKSATFALDGVGGNSGSVTAMPKSGSRPLTATVKDSRGRSASFAGAVNVLAYAPPKVSSFQARRATSANAVNEAGTYIRVDLAAVVQSLTVGGTQKNTSTIRVFTRAKGVAAWTARNVITGAALAYNSNFLVSGGGNYPIDQSFEVRVEVADKLLTSANQATVSTAKVDMHLGPDGVAVGKYHTRGAFEVGGDAYTEGNTYADGSLYNRGAFPVWPVGMMFPWAGGNYPAGIALCNGQALSRTTYADLFAAIGTAFGAGNGSTTFNVPNMTGRTVVGIDTAQTEFNARGKQGGSKTHTLTEAEMPSHTHGGYQSTGYGTGGSAVAAYPTSSGTSVSAITQAKGGGGAHNNLQPYTAINWVIVAR